MAKHKNNKVEVNEVKAIEAQEISLQQLNDVIAVGTAEQAIAVSNVIKGLRKAYLQALPFPQTVKLNKRMLAVCAYVLCLENKAIASKLLAYTICNEKIGHAGQMLIGECGDNSGMQGYVKPQAAWFTKLQAQGVCNVHTQYLRDTASKFGIELPQA